MRLSEKQLAVIGAGNIGKILIERLLTGGVPAQNLTVCDSNSVRASTVATQYGIRTGIPADSTVCEADALLLTVPPKEVFNALLVFADWVCKCRLIISFAAAVPLSKIESMLRPGTPVARVMPNAPSLVGQGMNPVAYGSAVTTDERTLVEAILSTLGETMVVLDEQMNWCVGLTGAAMRSLIPVLEGMTHAGVDAGLSEGDARRMAAQVMLGTATLVLETDRTIEEIKSLTPMETVDESALAQLFYTSALTAKEKMEALQHKLRLDAWS